MRHQVNSIYRALACGLVLLLSAVAHAEDSIGVSRLAGDWNNDASGENIIIERGLLGWDIWISNSGQGRISDEETAGANITAGGANIKVDGRGFSCSYYVTMNSAISMDWQLRKGEPEARCLRGPFSRIVAAESEHKPAGISTSPAPKRLVLRRLVTTRQDHAPWLSAEPRRRAQLQYDAYCSCYYDASNRYVAGPDAAVPEAARPAAVAPQPECGGGLVADCRIQ